MQNDLMFRDALKGGIYPQPIGGVGVTMVNIRDIADAAVAELLRRERAPHPLPRTTIELVGPETLTGEEITAIWASVLGNEVRYGGNDLATFESQAAGMMPGWMAHDFRLMLRAFHRFGMIPGKDSRATFEALIGHPLRSYRAFAQEAVATWRAASDAGLMTPLCARGWTSSATFRGQAPTANAALPGPIALPS